MIANAPVIQSNPIQSNTNPIQSESESNGTSANELNERFERFWKAYPRKESKPKARTAFEKIKTDEELLRKMLDSIERWKKTDQWQEDGGRYIPHPSTWLNQGRWMDEGIDESIIIDRPKSRVAQELEESYDIIKQWVKEEKARSNDD